MQNIASMRGCSLIAMSPVPHDSPGAPYCSDIHVYEPNWAKFADCAAQNQLDRTDPHFQHLVNQVDFLFSLLKKKSRFSSIRPIRLLESIRFSPSK